MPITRERRALKHSEIERHCLEKRLRPYFDPLIHQCSKKPSRQHGARVIDCPQNVVELRKLLHTFQQLEIAERKTISKINREKRSIKDKLGKQLKYSDTCDRARETVDMAIPPGFRYRNNGDIKSSESKATVRQKMADCIEKRLGTRSLGSLSTSVHSHSDIQLSPGGDAGTTKLRLSNTEIRVELAELEKELQELKGLSHIANINERISLVRSQLSKVKSFVKLEADLPEPTKSNCLNNLKPSKCYKSGGSVGLCEDKQQRKNAKTFSAERFSRISSRSHCSACEARLKCVNETGNVKACKSPLRRWQAAPTGVYVRKLEGSRPRPTGSQAFSSTKKVSGTLAKQPDTPSKTISIGKKYKTVGKSIMETTQSTPEIPRGRGTKLQYMQRLSLDKSASDAVTVNVDRPYGTNFGFTPGTDKSSVHFLQQETSPGKRKQGEIDTLDPVAGNSMSTEQQFRFVMCKSQISDKNSLALLNDLANKEENNHLQLVRKASENSTRSKTTATKYAQSMFDFRQQVAFPGEVRTSKMARIRNKTEAEYQIAGVKVQEFLSTLPQTSSSIPRWRNSRGKIVSNSDSTGRKELSTSEAPQMTWAEFKRSKEDVKYFDKIMGPSACTLYVQEQRDKFFKRKVARNSVEELSKCRYLRLNPDSKENKLSGEGDTTK